MQQHHIRHSDAIVTTTTQRSSSSNNAAAFDQNDRTLKSEMRMSKGATTHTGWRERSASLWIQTELICLLQKPSKCWLAGLGQSRRNGGKFESEALLLRPLYSTLFQPCILWSNAEILLFRARRKLKTRQTENVIKQYTHTHVRTWGKRGGI